MQDRNNLISFLQVFGILLVVIGHSDYGAPEEPLWHTWIYSFHMPLFMFISGFLLRYGAERKGIALADTNSGFIWKKVKRLLIPYVCISTLAFFPKALLSRFAARPLEVSWDTYIRMLVYPWDNVIMFFWFLPTLFIIFLIVFYGARLLRKLDAYWGGAHGFIIGFSSFTYLQSFTRHFTAELARSNILLILFLFRILLLPISCYQSAE